MGVTKKLTRTQEQLTALQEHARALGKRSDGHAGFLPCPQHVKEILSSLKTGVALSEEHCKNISIGTTIALAKPEARAKMSAKAKGRKLTPEALKNRCQPCTIDGIKIYESRKALTAELGFGKSGWKHPHFRYI